MLYCFFFSVAHYPVLSCTDP